MDPWILEATHGVRNGRIQETERMRRVIPLQSL